MKNITHPEVIELPRPGDRSPVQVERKYRLNLSTGIHLFFLRTAPGGAQFCLFNADKKLVAAGALDFQETPYAVLRRTLTDDERLPFPAEEIELWMRSWPPEERLLINVLSPVPYADEETPRAS